MTSPERVRWECAIVRRRVYHPTGRWTNTFAERAPVRLMFGQTSRISTECISNVLKVRAQVITIEPPFDLTTKVAAEFYNKKSLCSWIRDPTGLARVSSGHCEDCREPASNELPFKINGSKGSSWRDSSISRENLLASKCSEIREFSLNLTS